jgi:DNA-binding HxlR family transcriptional regulator
LIYGPTSLSSVSMTASKAKDEGGVRPCAIADGLDLLGERWALLVIREIFWGNHRFGEIQEKTGAPRDILSARLKRLCEEGLIERRRYSERPPRDEYHLTESGRAVQPLLLAIQDWALRYRPRSKKEPAPASMHHHDHDVDPEARVFCRVCGERIEAEAVKV